MLNPLSQAQIEAITLWHLVQHSLAGFRKIQAHYPSLADALQAGQLPVWQALGLHKSHLQRFQEFHSAQGRQQFQRCLQQIQQQSDFVLTCTDPDYPQQLLPYGDRPPVIFGQGNAQALLQPQIAIVGSRKPSPHGCQTAYDFAFYLSEQGFYICSGLAQGIDQAAHQAALKHRRTIAVMGTGLDQTYPPQHQGLRRDIQERGGAVISEFLPQTPPLQHHFPRRNRIVSGLSLGVIVAEAGLKSGSLITAKTAAEQGKAVFAIPGHIYGEFHQGCHQLIREGAILIDHPQQALEDLALPAQWQAAQLQAAQPAAADEPDVPEHLHELHQQLDWTGQTLDQLAQRTQRDAPALTAQLMELELLGLALQQAGCYLRCRAGK